MKRAAANLLVLQLKRNSYYLLSLSLISVLLVGRCQAQAGIDVRAVNISLPAIVFCIAITIMCSCFWVCFCRMLLQRKRHYHRIRPSHPSTIQHSIYSPGHQSPSHYGTGGTPVQRSYPPPTELPGVTPSSTSRPYTHISPPFSSPMEAPTSSESTAPPQPYEPVALPEATLHHGEAPPDYEEAIKMKPPDMSDQD